MRPVAEADLTWYWGVGPDSWAGDAGLRSNLGAQLEAIAAGINAVPTPDSNASEDAMIDRMLFAARATDIEARLRLLSAADVLVLRVHFTGRGLTFGISSAAVFTEQAKAMCGKLPAIEELRAELMKLKNAKHPTVTTLERETVRLVREATDRYDSTEIKPTRRMQIRHPTRGRA